MAKVHVTNVNVMNNPSDFLAKFQFELTFECIEELKEDLEWRMIYVGSAESEDYDQVLDTIYVGPVPEGRHVFVFEADAPDSTKIPEDDAVGVTVVMLTCSYREQEFVRVGYFINNDYADAELRENPPAKPMFDKLTRNILASKPRVTRFKINWDEGQQMDNTNDGVTQDCGIPIPMDDESAQANDLARITNTGLTMFKIDTEPNEDEEDSLEMPPYNGVHAMNDNSNSFAMEC